MIINKLLAFILPSITLMGCSNNVLNNHINKVTTVIDNTLAFETMEVKEYLDENRKEYDQYLLSQSPNMGYYKSYKGENSPLNGIQKIYIEDKNIEGLIIDTKYFGDEQGVLKFEPSDGTKFNQDFEDGKKFNNQKYIISNANNISLIRQNHNGYTFEFSEKFFKDERKRQLKEIEKLINTTEDELMKNSHIRFKELIENKEDEKMKITFEIENDLIRRITTTSSFKNKVDNTEETIIKVIEIRKFNENDNIRNEINTAYENTK